MTKIAMIGGSGFDDPDFLTNVKSMKMGTPFGPLSHDLITGKFGETEVTIVLRHGKGHRIRPSAVNYRANIWALKEIGISHIVATTACGSLREEIEPGHLVFPDQFIDRTAGRKSTFYEGEAGCPYLHGRPVLRTTSANIDRHSGTREYPTPSYRHDGHNRRAQIFNKS